MPRTFRLLFHLADIIISNLLKLAITVAGVALRLAKKIGIYVYRKIKEYTQDKENAAVESAVRRGKVIKLAKYKRKAC